MLRGSRAPIMVRPMADAIQDFRELISLWPSMGQFGREVAGDKERGRIFYRRNRVPRELHAKVVEAAQARGFDGITSEFLDRLYSAGRKQGR